MPQKNPHKHNVSHSGAGGMSRRKFLLTSAAGLGAGAIAAFPAEAAQRGYRVNLSVGDRARDAYQQALTIGR
jgi:hypothetical protein